MLTPAPRRAVGRTTDMLSDTQGWNCQRVLTSRNNIAIDLDLCGKNAPASVVTKLIATVGRKVYAHS